MSSSKPLPVLTEAVRRLLSEIIRTTEDNELDKSNSSAWLSVYTYKTDGEGNISYPEVTLKNDRAVRSLLDHLVDAGLIEVLNVIERPYRPDNIRLTTDYQFIADFEFRAKNLAHLKQLASGPIQVTEQPTYNPDSGLLTLQGKTTKVIGTKQRLLLEMLFSSTDLGREWATDEVLDYIDPSGSGAYREGWHRDTGNALNKKLSQADELGIKDFLVPTRASIKINPKYLV